MSNSLPVATSVSEWKSVAVGDRLLVAASVSEWKSVAAVYDPRQNEAVSRRHFGGHRPPLQVWLLAAEQESRAAGFIQKGGGSFGGREREPLGRLGALSLSNGRVDQKGRLYV